MILKLISVAAFALIATSAFFITKSPNPQINTPSNQQINSVSNQQPEELGKVHWLRDLDTGKSEAAKSGKPILILFQEVPGCSNCTGYGNNTLSNPLIVEAIERYFVPVCIYNNKGGKDGDALKHFNEPAWNNPVIRIVQADLHDLVLRMPNFNSSLQLVNGIRRVLDLTGQSAPRYLELLEEELSARESGLATATFSMYCFWVGEGTFGNIRGVIETEPGYQDGKEVVKVLFDPIVSNRDALEDLTKPKGVSVCSKNEGFRSDHEPKYYLSHTDYRFVPMTPLQATRANSLIGNDKSPDELFSPGQLALLKKVKENPKKGWKNMIGRKDLSVAWAEAGD